MGQNVSTLLQGVQDADANALKRVEAMSARPIHAKRLVAAGAVNVVSQCLREHPILRQTAAGCLQNLAILDEGNEALLGTGTVKSLCDYLDGAVESKDEGLSSRCAGAIANTGGKHIVEVAEAGGMGSLMAALVEAEDSSTRATCARAVANLSQHVHDPTLDGQAIRLLEEQFLESLPAVAPLLTASPSEDDLQIDFHGQMAVAISQFAAHKAHRARIGKAGVIPPLVRCLASPLPLALRCAAARALARLALCDTNQATEGGAHQRRRTWAPRPTKIGVCSS